MADAITVVWRVIPRIRSFTTDIFDVAIYGVGVKRNECVWGDRVGTQIF